MAGRDDELVLGIEVTLREDADLPAVVEDIRDLYRVLNEYHLLLGGKGLKVDSVAIKERVPEWAFHR